MQSIIVTDSVESFCRYVILPKDFEKAYKTTVKKGESEFEFYR